MVPWLLTTKVTAPARTDFYVDRPQLIERIDQSGCPIVILWAPSGFGKTTLLSEIFHRERGRGNLAAWFSVDEDDTEEAVGLYLMYAFEHAGVNLGRTADADEYRLDLLAHEVEKQDTPCLLVIDEVERLSRHAVEALDFFLHRAPENLRIVLGLRDNPGLDLSTAVLEGRGIVVGTDQLRFSKPEVENFFAGDLSRRELDLVVERTEGWPIALGLYRIIRAADARTAPTDKLLDNLSGEEGIAANWLGARLLRGMDDEDREFLFDLAQFDWIEPAIVDDVLNLNDTGSRLTELAAFRGLLQQLDTDADRWHLHPLLKELCVVERLREHPDRHRQLHRDIAEAMLEGGHLLPAVRHASEARDWELVGSALVRAGGLRLWLREGMTRLGAAQRCLSEEVADRFPRLAMLRCRLLIHESRLMEARSLYEIVRLRTEDFSRDRTDGDDGALRAEAMIIRTNLIGYGCQPYGDEMVGELIASYTQVKDEEESDPETVGCFAALLCAAHHQKAQFERGSAFAAAAKAQYRLCNSQHGAMHVELHCGIIAMAQGRSVEAEDHYARASRIAEQHFPLDSAIAQMAQVLMAELDLERNRMTPVREQAIRFPVPFRNVAAWLDVYAGANEVAAEWRFETGGIDDVLNFVEASCDWADSQGLVCVSRHSLALRIGYLATVERVEEAQAAWSDAGFGNDFQGLLNVDQLSWREMEAISCARLQLLIASGELSRARELADRLANFTRERGLVRTRMRCLALAMVLEHRAGSTGAAMSNLVELLNLQVETGFTRPMVRACTTSQLLLDRLLETKTQPRVRESAHAVLSQLRSVERAMSVQLTSRERVVLEWLAQGRRDKEIARNLGLTVSGVRYHLNNIYRKTGASGRGEAISRAKAAGAIS